MSVLPDVLLRTSVEPNARPAASGSAPAGETFADVYASQRQTTKASETKPEIERPQAKEASTSEVEQEEAPVEVAEDGNLLPQEEPEVLVGELIDSPLWAMLQETTPVDPAQVLITSGYMPPVANPHVTLDPEITVDAELEALTSVKTSQPILALEATEEELPDITLTKLITSIEAPEISDEVGFKLEALAAKSVGVQEVAPDASNRLNTVAQTLNPTVSAQARSVVVPGAPLAPQQAGFSEAVMDRVMWMSSQNLKTAHIQLDPAELGRLDVRVNVSGDQTHVIFSSAHANVRDALESQMQRLRELFTQQGLGQPNVDVSDRSQQQERQATANFSRGASGDHGQEQDLAPINSGEPMSSALRSGTGLVDYYA